MITSTPSLGGTTGAGLGTSSTTGLGGSEGRVTSDSCDGNLNPELVEALSVKESTTTPAWFALLILLKVSWPLGGRGRRG